MNTHFIEKKTNLYFESHFIKNVFLSLIQEILILIKGVKINLRIITKLNSHFSKTDS